MMTFVTQTNPVLHHGYTYLDKIGELSKSKVKREVLVNLLIFPHYLLVNTDIHRP